MHVVDWLVLAGYLGILMAIGIYFSRKQSSLDEFVRGSQNIGWLAIGLSLMAALNSGIDYIQTPAIVFAFGLVYLSLIVSWVFLYPWVTLVTYPFYQRLDVLSAYEYLEIRFGLETRLLGAGIFVLWRICWMSVALYVPCLTINSATGGDINVPVMIVVLGAVVTLYTMLGGIRAVIWTDVLQCCVMFCGLIAIVAVVISSVPGGVPRIFAVAREAGRLQLTADVAGWRDASWLQRLSSYFTTDVTFLGIAIGTLLSRMAAFTSDQVAVQRFQSMKEKKQAGNALIVNAVSDIAWSVILGFIGIALFAYYQYSPFPEGLQNDQVVPHFMSRAFPVALKGLVIASIVAASLSSVDAALNSATSVIMVDFYHRIWRGAIRPVDHASPEEQARQLFLSRLVNFGLGICMTVLAMNVGRMGEIYEAANRLLGAFFGSLFGMFALGMFSRCAHRYGVLLAASAGLVASCFFSFFKSLGAIHEPLGNWLGFGFVDFASNLSWQWPPVIGIVTTLLVGQCVSWCVASKGNDRAPLTYWEVMRSETSNVR